MVLRTKGLKSYNKTKPMSFDEFQPEIDWWGNETDGFASRIETEQAWKVSIDDLKARNYNLDIKNPHVGELIIHDPDKLIKKYQKKQQETIKLRDKLKTILADAIDSDLAIK
jgi:type I restriction enzyme M protein